MARITAWVVVAAILSATALIADDIQRVVLPVKVNEVAHGEVLAAVVGDDVLVPRTLLDEIGLSLKVSPAREIAGEQYFSLRALSPDLQFVFNTDDLTLSISADPRLLAHNVLDIKRGMRPVPDRGGDPTAFFNYALSGQRSDTPIFFGELGGSRGNSLFYTGFSRNTEGFSRGLSYANFDVPSRLQRLTVGDAIVGGDPLGGTLELGGVAVTREFSLQPYLVRYPSVDVSGTAATPSTVEVYVNGQLTNRIAVQPGVFTLHDLPVSGGLGSTRLVVRDVFGRESIQDGSFYYSTTALRKGLSDYVFSAGFVRDEFGDSSFDYGRAATLLQYRRGITNSVTLGGRFEADRDLLSGGPRAAFGTRFGDIDVAAAASRQDGRSGTAGLLMYRFVTNRFSLGFSTIQRSDDYTTLSLRTSDDRVKRDVNVFASWIIRSVSLGVTANDSRTRSGQTLRRVALQGTAPLGRWGSLFTSVGSTEQAGKREPEVIVGLTVGLSHFTSGSALVQRSGGTDSVHTEVRRPLTLANGFGWAIQNDSRSDSSSALLQYQTSFGRYEVTVDPDRTEDAGYSAAGGLVYIGGAFLPSRPVQESYALARVGVPGVKVFASNQEVGRTNRSGDLLVSHLVAHYGNEISLQDKDIPIDYIVESTKVTVVPPARGGVLAKFPVRKIRSYVGRIQLDIVGQPYVPSLGIVAVREPNGETLNLALGRAGEFYAEDLAPGTYDARLRIGKVGCDLKLVLPLSDTAVTDVGVIRCAP